MTAATTADAGHVFSDATDAGNALLVEAGGEEMKQRGGGGVGGRYAKDVQGLGKAYLETVQRMCTVQRVYKEYGEKCKRDIQKLYKRCPKDAQTIYVQ